MTAPKPFELPLPRNCYGHTPADLALMDQERALGMVEVGHPALLAAARDIGAAAIGSDRILDLIEETRRIVEGKRDDPTAAQRARTLVGFAAVQAGYEERLIWIDMQVGTDNKGLSRPQWFIDPEVVDRSDEEDERREGCFSTGIVRGLVSRPTTLVFKAYTADSPHKKQTVVTEGFTARIAGHEIDHPDGILFPDRITDERKRHIVHAEEAHLYPDHAHEWPRTMTVSQWRAYRRGLALPIAA